jgi:hypothetical protein
MSVELDHVVEGPVDAHVDRAAAGTGQLDQEGAL